MAWQQPFWGARRLAREVYQNLLDAELNRPTGAVIRVWLDVGTRYYRDV
jgi:hypothetical protein